MMTTKGNPRKLPLKVYEGLVGNLWRLLEWYYYRPKLFPSTKPTVWKHLRQYQMHI